MNDSYDFEIRITLVNREQHEDTVFEQTISAVDEEGLVKTPVIPQIKRANAMAIERSDDGTDWKVDIACLKVVDPATGKTDWDDDLMPQRDEVSAYLKHHVPDMQIAHA